MFFVTCPDGPFTCRHLDALIISRIYYFFRFVSPFPFLVVDKMDVDQNSYFIASYNINFIFLGGSSSIKMQFRETDRRGGDGKCALLTPLPPLHPAKRRRSGGEGGQIHLAHLQCDGGGGGDLNQVSNFGRQKLSALPLQYFLFFLSIISIWRLGNYAFFPP